MATIGTVELALSETLTSATATVTYTLTGTALEIFQKRMFSEVVELIGDDKSIGDDGNSEPIKGGRIASVVSFPVATLDRTRKITLPISAIDEDPGLNPGILTPKRDEIRATVTLRQLSATAVTATSEVVRRGGEQLT